ncbi:hypothetical protein JCM33374_g1697 [Metschnikowia sp. JCM 33374]|nr:hypothetical protein JCM33374_g1697 [Metschnikowia sp. JCM 33374]
MTAQKVIELAQPGEARKVINAVLTIAGSDSSGGAGIEADIKTISAHKAYAMTCITALTAQNTQGVDAVEEVSKDHLRQALKTNFADFVEGYEGSHPLKVVKTGMLTTSSAQVLTEFLGYLQEKNVSLVVDPVMIATTGRTLMESETVQLLLHDIIPGSKLCTPNFEEAMTLWQAAEGVPADAHAFDSVDTFVEFVIALQKKLGSENLLVKGGHVPFLDGKRVPENSPLVKENNEDLHIIDILYESKTEEVTIFKSKRIPTKNSHGTGCTLASAISANLANGKPLSNAVALSINYVHKGMVAVGGSLGHGNGPLNHTVVPSSNFIGVAHGKNLDRAKEHGSVYEYLKNHPSIKPSWERYTKHPFLKLLATNQLPFDDFMYFLKQDFYYLINYAQVHGHAASVAPDCEQIEAQSHIIGNIMNEINRHKEKLSKRYNIDYDQAELDKDLQPGPACVAYCDYLNKIGREQDFIAIKVAVAPCLHGYAEGGWYGLDIRSKFDGKLNVLESQEQSDVYDSWLDDYASDWFREAHENGIRLLDNLFSKEKLSEQREAELLTMFRDVSDLEVAFWDEVVDRSKRRQ